MTGGLCFAPSRSRCRQTLSDDFKALMYNMTSGSPLSSSSSDGWSHHKIKINFPTSCTDHDKHLCLQPAGSSQLWMVRKSTIGPLIFCNLCVYLNFLQMGCGICKILQFLVSWIVLAESTRIVSQTRIIPELVEVSLACSQHF